jgi:hypothetical protein
MYKIAILLIMPFLTLLITGGNRAYSSSISKPVNTSELVKYYKGREFITLSFKQFATLTGQKQNLRNRLSFGIMKLKVKHDLKKNPDLMISEFYRPHEKTPTWKIILWVLVGLLVLPLLIIGIADHK